MIGQHRQVRHPRPHLVVVLLRHDPHGLCDMTEVVHQRLVTRPLVSSPTNVALLVRLTIKIMSVHRHLLNQLLGSHGVEGKHSPRF